MTRGWGSSGCPFFMKDFHLCYTLVPFPPLFMFRAGLFVPFILFLLIGCAKQSLPPPADVPPEDVGSPTTAMPVPGVEGVEEMLAFGIYTDYTDDVIGDGDPSVLFFHAVWCPICKRTDETLTQWYEEEDFPLSVYKVDYDNSSDLKERYGVTYQHTFVLLDGEGNTLKVLAAPSDEDLKSLLQTVP